MTDCDDPEFFPCDDCSDYIDSLMDTVWRQQAATLVDNMSSLIVNAVRTVPPRGAVDPNTEGVSRLVNLMADVIVVAIMRAFPVAAERINVVDVVHAAILKNLHAYQDQEKANAVGVGKAKKGNAGSSPW